VVRCFENDDIVHVAGRIDPLRDIDIIDTELALADLETVEKGLLRAEKAAKAGDKDAIKQRELLKQLRAHLDQGKPARSLLRDAAERLLVREHCLITAKPLMYVANVAEDGFVNNPHLDAVRARARPKVPTSSPCAPRSRPRSRSSMKETARRSSASSGVEEPGLNRVIRAAYHLLGLQTFFTAGPKEVRAWTVRVGATAPQAAGEIHTDFEKGFIRAKSSPTTTTCR
jgi:GTP-binding protein YchF